MLCNTVTLVPKSNTNGTENMLLFGGDTTLGNMLSRAHTERATGTFYQKASLIGACELRRTDRASG
jgi:hypothetical protein